MESVFKEDIVVRLNDNQAGIKPGDIRKVIGFLEDKPTQPQLENQNQMNFCHSLSNLRKATSKERDAYFKGIRNIKDIPKSQELTFFLW